MTGLLDDIMGAPPPRSPPPRRENAPASPQPSTPADMARSIPPGLAGGVAAMLGFPVDAYNLAITPFAWARNQITGRNDPSPQIDIGRAQDYRRLIGSGMNAIGAPGVTDYQPQTLPGRMVQQGLEFAVPAALAPGAGLARTMQAAPRMGAVWAGVGAAQEAAGTGVRELGLPPEIEAAVRAAVTASLGLAGTAPGAARANAGRMMRERLAGIPDEQMNAARVRQQASQDIGVPLVGGEALGDAGRRVQQLASDVMQSPQGRELPRALGRRQPQVQNAAAQVIDDIMPGPIPPVAQVVDDVARGGREVIQEARRARTAAADPLYRQAALQPIEPRVLAPLLRELDESVARVGSNSALGRALTDYRNRIAPPAAPPGTPGAAVPPPGALPMTGPLAQTYRETREGIYPAGRGEPVRPMMAQERGTIGPVNLQLRDVLEANNPTFRAAQDTYRAMTPRVNELRSPGLFGGMQNAVAETGSIPAAFGRQLGMIAPTDATMTTPQTIARLFGEMSGPAPTALPRLAQRGLLSNLETAINSGPRGTIGNPTAGARFALDTVGRPGSAAETNWRAVMSGIEQSRNLPAGQLQTGFDRLMDVLRHTGQIPGAGSPTAGRMATAREASRSNVAALAETPNLAQGSVFGQAARGIRDLAQRGTYRVLDRVLADPDNINRLVELSRVPAGSTRAQRIIANIINTGTAINTGLDAPQEQP